MSGDHIVGGTWTLPDGSEISGEYATIDGLAVRAGVTSHDVRYHIRKGHVVGCHRVGRRYLIPLDVVDDIVDTIKRYGTWTAPGASDLAIKGAWTTVAGVPISGTFANVKGLAGLLGVTPKTVQGHIRDGDVAHHAVPLGRDGGYRYLIPLDEVMRLKAQVRAGHPWPRPPVEAK